MKGGFQVGPFPSPNPRRFRYLATLVMDGLRRLALSHFEDQADIVIESGNKDVVALGSDPEPQTFSPHPTLPEKPPAPPTQPEEADLQTPNTTPSSPSRWAVLLARIYEVFPLICPTCQTPLTFIAFLTDPEPITQILAHIGEPTSPPLLHPARGPPQTELAMGPHRGEEEEVAQESFPDDLNQTTPFDPAEPEPIPEDDFDQRWDA